jgi:hypothetical protein
MSSAYVSGRVPARYADENTSHRFVSVCQRLTQPFPIIHIALILFRRGIRSTDYGNQARLLTDFWFREGHGWDWTGRVVYLPKSP